MLTSRPECAPSLVAAKAVSVEATVVVTEVADTLAVPVASPAT